MKDCKSDRHVCAERIRRKGSHEVDGLGTVKANVFEPAVIK